jgi:hypothetical protein
MAKSKTRPITVKKFAIRVDGKGLLPPEMKERPPNVGLPALFLVQSSQFMSPAPVCSIEQQGRQ